MSISSGGRQIKTSILWWSCIYYCICSYLPSLTSTVFLNWTCSPMGDFRRSFFTVVRMLRHTQAILSMRLHAQIRQKGPICLLPPVSQKSPIERSWIKLIKDFFCFNMFACPITSALVVDVRNSMFYACLKNVMFWMILFHGVFRTLLQLYYFA